jgi:hypothetical protein
MQTDEQINVSLVVSPPPRSPLVAKKTVYVMPRPPLDPLTNVGRCPRPSANCSDTSPSRRQSSISYLPPDSPRLWSPRNALTGSNTFERRSSLSSSNSPVKDGRSRTRSVSQRAIPEPAVLTLAERYVSHSRSITRIHSHMEQTKNTYISQ